MQQRIHSVIPLYAPRKKIYPREVSGRFTRLRWLCVWLTQLVYFGLPWLTWNGRPAVLFDLAARKFHLFGVVLWPQDLIYLAGVLVICACLLFLLSTIGGRVWCGLACPHTVYTEIFLWVERRIEGNRSARIRLDKQPLSPGKFARKAGKHAAWIAIALWTGVTLVAYFTPMRVLLREIAVLDIGPWQAFWMLFYGGFAYMNAGWMREQICQYLCAYARFQSVMFDGDTLLITYDGSRGEPRGARRTWRAGAGPKLGDCIDCGLCVQVCPAGIDIRDGLQFACIDCAACIDACDGVMEKVGAPRGLIRHANGRLVRKGPRYRVLAYAVILAAAFSLWLGMLATRTPLKLNIVLDRGVMGREVEGGMVENVYRMQLMNADERAHRFHLSVSGLISPQLVSDASIAVGPAEARTFVARVRARPGNAADGSTPIRFELSAEDAPALRVAEPAVFLLPGRR